MKNIVRNRLFEDPDTSFARENILNWYDTPSHPFAVNSQAGMVIVGPNKSTHDILSSLSVISYKDWEGRIWPKDGVVAFWEAPSKKVLKHIWEEIINSKYLKLYNLTLEDIDKFVFDIPNPDQTSDEEDAFFYFKNYPDNPQIQYRQEKFEVKEKRPQHTISPLNKEKIKVPDGLGSKRYGEKKPIEWRQAMQAESVKPKIKLVCESLDEAMVGEIPIIDTNTYVEQMSKGVNDKIDFIAKIDIDCILDFGCADGYILNAINLKYPNIKGLIGYDLDEHMIDKLSSKYSNIKATDNWNEALYLATEYDKVALSLMSVIHEVYSYGSPQIIHNFWRKQVFNPKFKYVIIRDMMPAKEYWKEKPSEEDIKKLKNKLWKQRKYKKSFEKEWGNITLNIGNMLHWLLKYDYKSNWGREVKENYLPVSIETVKSKIPNNWKIIHEDHYIFKPISDKVKNDYNIELKHPTHVKMIIENLNAR